MLGSLGSSLTRDVVDSRRGRLEAGAGLFLLSWVIPAALGNSCCAGGFRAGITARYRMPLLSVVFYAAT
jgi:hypothetical protein